MEPEDSKKQAMMGPAVTSASRDSNVVRGVSVLEKGKGPAFWLLGALRPMPCNEGGVGC